MIFFEGKKYREIDASDVHLGDLKVSYGLVTSVEFAGNLGNRLATSHEHQEVKAKYYRRHIPRTFDEWMEVAPASSSTEEALRKAFEAGKEAGGA